ncbi:UDP-N-acetylmuramoyl-L-alanyl-D-glutamate--2,6-diaminopimelate ligase [Porcipelethomonas ammoniilytica]|jgi:UDP-N-acetylmuramoyl-L-alanyl-D-glutamate--2,6-diaminopimelate ligase|uniref:UDP-N-acetylmuramoyl-L-alanyl-D-glutamate--2, 6-diaminopimelate ligase n=1 Tax=Porcipelethomonas ammoniilytica TaxID=2981722 RepID=UPI000822143F|nr:UDP-N-acetylmuramoyl-L-alanyl-D-glutamate--2,6-diaminopimelate ligase [Porcipelethomonas ammoniilytica]MCU6720193.1 UDP-N-acetylmuramoyl-L-alanyl-D-glutamate--2,6-diaminopimelate ligase [Porcipelethomonas ammoniilytica]SCJ04665.1 UDP-N-acetylmuramoyl-L-alanyl-D-glutamate--LD-lysine ligase [uncultured Ruminococcus sp.]
MRLYKLIEGLADINIPDREISSVTDNTKKVRKDCIFVCVKGGSFDGHDAAAEMLEKGAAVIVAERDLGLGNKQIITDNSRKFYGELCAAWFDHPEKKLKIIGVTGTNGKTTITNVIKNIFMKNGVKTGLIGTICNEIGDETVHTDNTTPMAFDYMCLLDKMVKAGCKYAVMEVSSFGLVQHRIGPTHFDMGIFTNLTQDHLDYHKTMENYYQAKRMMFDECDYALINTDDEYGRRIFSEISCKKERYGISSEADYYADAIKIKSDGTSFWYCYNGKSQLVNMKMTGMFNVSNVTAAISVCLKAGLPIEDILNAVSEYNGVKGRCEIIPTGRDFTVICDYAHTPDAVENILKSVREYTEGRLICLFGCGGNRDAKKRPLMAKAAAKFADRLIITSDNPRDEIPEAIIDDILAGLKDSEIPFDVVVDRTKAIHHSLKIAEKGDIIVLAGKGHEDYQVLPGNEHIHFDEREIVSEGLKLID